MSLRHVHTILLAAMLLLVGLLSVGPSGAEIVCSGDDCAHEVMVFRSGASDARAARRTPRAVGSRVRSVFMDVRRALLGAKPVVLLASAANGVAVPLRI